jgi:hypothetical protein
MTRIAIGNDADDGEEGRGVATRPFDWAILHAKLTVGQPARVTAAASTRRSTLGPTLTCIREVRCRISRWARLRRPRPDRVEAGKLGQIVLISVLAGVPRFDHEFLR